MDVLSLVSPKRGSPAPKHDREDHQPQLVDQVLSHRFSFHRVVFQPPTCVRVSRAFRGEIPAVTRSIARVHENSMTIVRNSIERRTPMTSIQPELWVETPREAVSFYEAAFGATVLHQVGDGDDIVAQLGVGNAAFWVAGTSATMKRLSPRTIDGATSRTLLVVEDPESVVRQAVAAGATELSRVNSEHGWRLGRIIDPFGHEWEIGVPTGDWPSS
jgi:PhnB protein